LHRLRSRGPTCEQTQPKSRSLPRCGSPPSPLYISSLALPRDLTKTHLYHITDISNLPSILANGGLLSDCALATVAHQVIGYSNIKLRRMTQYRIECCDNRFVGEFVPFYFCPRSPMLYTVNLGNTGRPPGCQASIVHLVTTVAVAVSQGRPYAISDVNAGTGYATFSCDLASIDDPAHLRWGDITSNQWKGRMHFKQAEFLVADRFDWSGIVHIGCHNAPVAAQVANLLPQHGGPSISVRPGWYY
jgi:ssDNA thymidine ADP-ribosyltransferase DarT-like protein